MAAYICSASLNSVVGCIFRHLRNISDVGQLELADITNLPASTISKIESGSINITVELIFMLCSYYQISLTEFFKILETAIQSLYEDKVFIYLTKTESVTIKENTISMDKATSVASAGALSGAKLTSASLATMGGGAIASSRDERATPTVIKEVGANNIGLGTAGGTALLGAMGAMGAVTFPALLGAGALLAISNPILGALSALKKNKGSTETGTFVKESLVEKVIDRKISGVGEASEDEMIDLPILSAKQIYSILKDTLDRLPIKELSEEQKNLYKIFAQKDT